MRIICLVLFIALLDNTVYAQKKGYEEIQIGKTMSGIKALNKYKLSPDAGVKNNWIVIGDSLKVFSIKIDYLDIEVDAKDVIKRVTAYAKDTVFRDYDAWLRNRDYIMRFINAGVGKENSGNVARESENKMCYAWTFADTKTALLFWVPKVDKNSSFLRSNFMVVWVEDSENMADKKF